MSQICLEYYKLMNTEASQDALDAVVSNIGNERTVRWHVKDSSNEKRKIPPLS